jgi:Flp pilus assembly protein TadG
MHSKRFFQILSPIRFLIFRREGAAAVEFAMLLAPFMFLLLGMLGIGTLYWANVAFDASVESVAKKVYEEAPLCADGDINFPYTQGCLGTRICEESGLLLISEAECKASIKVDIRTVKGDGTDPAIPPYVLSGNINPAAFQQQVGVKRNVVVMIRAAVRVPNWAVWAPQNAKVAGGNLLTAASMFRIRDEKEYLDVN